MSTSVRTVINTFFRSYKCQKVSYCTRNKNDGIQTANVTCVCKVKTKYICVRNDSIGLPKWPNGLRIKEIIIIGEEQ